MLTRVGQVLASKYRLEELLGSGGMGHVYRAVNEDVGREVAIKILRPEHALNAPVVERFLREARAANLVRHPNVVDVLDVGRDADGSPFIVQELLRGQDLSVFVAERGGKLTRGELEELFLPVVDAVAEAHAQGVVHRDIKPENVFLADPGRGRSRVPKLLDFGISKVRRPNVRVTEVGTMMGTPAYMAPEQIQGSHDADARTDVWALGVTLFELLTGRLPFEAEDAPALFVAIATKDVPRIVDVAPEIPAALSHVVERCVRRLPDDRYPSAQELARDLRLAFDGAELEPTQKRSYRPPAAPLGDDLVVPDLALPAHRKPTPAVKTIPRPPPDPGLTPPARDVPELTPARASSPSLPASAGRVEMGVAPAPELDAPFQRVPPASPPSVERPARASAPSFEDEIVRGGGYAAPDPQSRLAPDQRMSGLMLTPDVVERRPPLVLDRRASRVEAGPDLAFIVGVSVVGLAALMTTAVLTAFLHQPGGLQLVSLVTKPTSTTNLVVHGGLAVAGLVLAARSAIGGVRRWRELGGRSSALFSSVAAGALLFAAIELARAAW